MPWSRPSRLCRSSVCEDAPPGAAVPTNWEFVARHDFSSAARGGVR
jgi:hypothetical protein